MRADRERASVEAFYVLLGVSLLATVITEITSGVWGVHAGTLFPWRHVRPFPLYGVGPLCVEWALLASSGAALAIGFARNVASRVALVVTAVSLTQRYSNAHALALIVLFFVALDPASPRDARFAFDAHPNFALIRNQLIVVYLFSAANKIAHGFTSGTSLVNLLGVSAANGRILAIATVLGELAIPALLSMRPREGIAAASLMHIAFAIALPGLWPFTILMIAMSALFAGAPPRSFRRSA